MHVIGEVTILEQGSCIQVSLGNEVRIFVRRSRNVSDCWRKQMH